MIRIFDGKTPRIDPTAFVAETAYVIGDVEIGPGSGIWPGAVVRGDFAPIRIGASTQIEDNSVVHTGMPLSIGDNVTIGHGVVIHCSRVGDRCLIGNNATLLDGAEIGDGSIVAAGAVVTPRTVVPPGSFVAGVPAEVRGRASETSRGRERRVAEGGRAGGGGYSDLIRRYKEQGLEPPRD